MDKLKHFALGYFVNLFTIMITSAFMSPYYGLLFCAIGHASWELYQKIKGGTNTRKEMLIDFIHGFVTAIPFAYFINEMC